MTSDSYTIRNYQPADLHQYVRFHTETESICRAGDTFFLASLKGEPEIQENELLDSNSGDMDSSVLCPRNSSAGFEKNLFLAEKQGEIVGACRVVPEPAIDRAVLMLRVAPGSLARGYAAGLPQAAVKRAGELNLTQVHAELQEKDTAARDLFAGLGFKPVRRYTEMTLDLESASIIEPEHEDLSVRPLEQGEEPKFTELQNRAFGGSWGFCPNTTSEIVQQLNAPGYSHDGVMVAYHGEEAVGYCWTCELTEPDRTSGATTGRIHMMGIAPEFQGRGFGKYILWSGLKHLASKGIQTVELTMDNENEAAGLLYEGAGFTPKTALVWYEKNLK